MTCSELRYHLNMSSLFLNKLKQKHVVFTLERFKSTDVWFNSNWWGHVGESSSQSHQSHCGEEGGRGGDLGGGCRFNLEHRAVIQRQQPFTPSDIGVNNSPNPQSVFGLWEEPGEPLHTHEGEHENPIQKDHQVPPRSPCCKAEALTTFPRCCPFQCMILGNYFVCHNRMFY